MSDATLQTTGLSVRFGGLLAVDNVDLDCRPGELTGLIGPNGAGKTTFIDAITGFLPKNATGSAQFDGEDVMGLAPHKLAHRGLCRTWQMLELFDDISVRANLDVASSRLTPMRALVDYFKGSDIDDRIESTLELLNLKDVAERSPSELSQGQRKLVGVGRALVADAKLLLLDEPAAGLDRQETVWLGLQLRRIVESGTPILMVDHDMGLVLSVSDRIHVLEFGKLIASGTPAEIRKDERVIAAYLGGSGGEE
ncbi:MAG: ABC transporter ATP-binding protein [Acidimicrobiia bacterium]